ncbi:MAG: hypothetical protein HYS06_10240 [Methylocystis sp.]|nr:hypothetical protein [Methylocystis sp.]MBI3275413.1 hypothetical protein [Methylocystis sp.]
MSRTFTLLAALLLVEAATAAPRSIADCEAIEAPDAYNRCLASFGPARGGGELGHGYARHHARVDGPGVSVERRPGGRLRMEFTPGVRGR